MQSFLRTILFSVFIAELCFFAPFGKTSPAETEEKEGDPVFLIKNDDALLALRKAAFDQLLSKSAPEMHEAISSLWRKKPKTDSAKMFRVYVDDKIAETKDPALIDAFQAELRNPKGNVATREILLNLLFKVESEKTKAYALQMIKNRKEPESLRLAALNGLALYETREVVSGLATSFARDGKESLKIRVTALNFLESRSNEKTKKIIYDIYESIVANSNENPRLQTYLIGKGVVVGIPDFHRILMSVMRDSKFDVVTRTAALHGLTQYKDLATILPGELRRLLSAEKGPFKQELKAVIESLNQPAS